MLNRQTIQKWAIILLVSIGLFSISCLGQQTVTGSVVDKSGNAVVGIEIWGDSFLQKIDRGHPYAYAITDASGKFSIDNPGTTLRIQDWKHRPSRVVLTPQTHNVEFVAEPREADAVKVPFCENSRLTKRARKRNRGEFWYFLLPRNAKVVRGSDADYVVYSLYFRDRKEHLRFASGPIYGGYQAPAGWLVEAQDFTERAILEPQGSMAGVDVSGSSKSGERFRSFGLGTDYISYRTGVPEAAAFFDAFIATACTPPLDPE